MVGPASLVLSYRERATGTGVSIAAVSPNGYELAFDYPLDFALGLVLGLVAPQPLSGNGFKILRWFVSFPCQGRIPANGRILACFPPCIASIRKG